MIASQVVHVLAAMLRQRRKLLDDLAAFFIVGTALIAGQIADVHRNIPVEGRTAFVTAELGLSNRFR